MVPLLAGVMMQLIGASGPAQGQATTTVGADPRINLVPFARVVKYTGDSPETLEVRELDRGIDGWEAWKGPDGRYMIGLEWDEPRDISEVNIEFRHAIADRELIKVQYFRGHWPHSGKGGWAKLDDPFHGRWVTIKAEWWAGDRDVTFAFGPCGEDDPADPNAPPLDYRRAFRLRFLLGDRELPPVRHMRAYGPGGFADATLDVRIEPTSPFQPPLEVSVLNGTTEVTEISPSSGRIDLRYAGDDLDTPNRTIVTLRRVANADEGMSFLPAEVVKYGIIRVPAFGIVIAHRGSDKDLQAGYQPGMAVFDRVHAEPEQTWERARREVPELRKTAQRPEPLYLPLGPPDARQEIAVGYNGSIHLQKSALKVKADDSDRLKWPAEQAWQIRLGSGDPPFDHDAEGNVRQRLLDGYLPIVINSWRHERIEYEQTNVATFLQPQAAEGRGDETVILFSCLTMKNTGDQPASAVARFTIEPNESLAMKDGDVLATGLVKDGKRQAYPRPLHRFLLASEAGGEKTLTAVAGRLPDTTLQYRRQLGPGETARLVLAVPYVTLDSDADLKRLAALDFDAVLASEAQRWRGIIAKAATIEVPDTLLNDFYKAQLAHVLITADRDPYNGTRVLPAATYRYNVCLNESCHQIRSLEIRGLHDEAARFLDAVVKGQSTRGLHGRFSDKQGVLHGLPSKHGDYQSFNYNLDHGFVLWMLNEHYRFTRDREWLKGVADAMVAACDFVTRARTTPPESNTLAKGDMWWGEGLLPPGHLEDPPEWLWWFAVNAYACRGMWMTGEALEEIRHPEAVRIARDAIAFSEQLRRSCKEAMIRAPVVRLRDGTYVPHQPTRSRLRGRDLGWIRDALYGPVHLIDCGIYGVDSPEAEWILRDTEDNVFIGEERGRKLDSLESQWFSWGGITLQSNLLPNPLIYLRRGRPKHAIRAFYNSLAANVYADVRTFTEHPIEAYGMGRGPFFKSPDESAFIVWLRHLLILENGPDLELLAGVPRGWLEPGRKIRVKAAATWFGPIDLEVDSQSDPERIAVNLAGPRRNPPATIKLHLRAEKPIKAVTVNDRPFTAFDAEKATITLPGDVGQAIVVAVY